MRFLLVFLLFVLAPAAQAQENREWTFCTQDSDCVVVGGGCTITAVHKDFAAQGQAYCDRRNTLVECPESLDPAKFRAECKKTPVPCMDNSPEGCLSKRLKCEIAAETHWE